VVALMKRVPAGGEEGATKTGGLFRRRARAMRSRRWLHGSGEVRRGGITALRVQRLGMRREMSVWRIQGRGRRGSGGEGGGIVVVMGMGMGMGKKRKGGGQG